VTPRDLAAALQRLLDEGSSDNRLVIQRGHAWMVARGCRGGSELALEATASHYLPNDRKLDAEGVNELRSRGFAPHPPQRGLRRRYARADLRQAAHEATALLSGVYGAEGELELTFRFGDAEPTTNPRLVMAMKETAARRDQPSRFALYRSLLAATLLVPFEDGDLRVFGDLTGLEVFGCFTDGAMSDRFEPRGQDLRRLLGGPLVRRLLERKAGSLLLNPGGTVRGELYRNELESMASARSVAFKTPDD